MAGLACEQCQSESFEVLHTTPKMGRIYRERRCLECNAILITEERPLYYELFDNATLTKKRVHANDLTKEYVNA